MLGDYRITGRRANEIAAEIEQLVVSGSLAPGAILPPLRELAGEIGVNPNTVAAAYRVLRERGVIETAGRRGSRVLPRPAATSRDFVRLEIPPGARDLSEGNPDPALLPALGRALAAAARAEADSPVLYGRAAQEDRLLALAAASFAADGIPADHLAVTSGSLDAIERILQTWLRPGDTVAVEDPGWGALLDLLPALGLKTHPVRVDDDGPLTADLAEALDAGARAVVVTSRAQNPTGASLGSRRARELRELTERRPDVGVIEDDHGHGIVDLPFERVGAATSARWAVLRSVAKSLGPDLRTAVFAGDAETVERVRGRLRLGPGWVSLLLQRTAAELWAGHDPAPVAAAYRARRDELLAELAARGVRAHGRSGLNVWVPVRDETAAVAGLLRRGWGVAAGARFRVDAPPGIRITVASLRQGDAAALAEDVAALTGWGGGGRGDVLGRG
ncbi:aminotransferase class I/II-fold pyridoxal phosphate-dependent enzyme [Streptacidiphilus monticola]|uniref:Aminotransferase class I/II-fold pyridoxal phosphate-dependent enzyme n=1 Tax=Streptacidiphilus monticola TaxID=2161674 RepID=A0ABW1G006_9ACTN